MVIFLVLYVKEGIVTYICYIGVERNFKYGVMIILLRKACL